jgi:hypothetical protein
MSGPVFLLISGLYVFSREPVAVRMAGIKRTLTTKWGKAALAMGSTCAMGIVVVLAIWTSFSFRFTSFTGSNQLRQLRNARWGIFLEEHTFADNVIAFARAHQLLPEAYLHDFAFIGKSSRYRPAFLDGAWSNIGFRSFLPRAISYKTPLPVLFLLWTTGVAAYLR